jgi:hypothetical protein
VLGLYLQTNKCKVYHYPKVWPSIRRKLESTEKNWNVSSGVKRAHGQLLWPLVKGYNQPTVMPQGKIRRINIPTPRSSLPDCPANAAQKPNPTNPEGKKAAPQGTNVNFVFIFSLSLFCVCVWDNWGLHSGLVQASQELYHWTTAPAPIFMF